MGLDGSLTKALREFAAGDVSTFTATVVAVNKDNQTCHVTDIDNLEYTDVRLNAAVDGTTKITMFPKTGSKVLVSMIGRDRNALFVILTTEIESVSGIIEDTEFDVDAGGYKINRSGENLKEVLNDMIDEINKIKVLYGNTIDVAKMILIKERLNTILK